eukprot:1955463-Pleurochrysis_carterae.AAC.2
MCVGVIGITLAGFSVHVSVLHSPRLHRLHLFSCMSEAQGAGLVRGGLARSSLADVHSSSVVHLGQSSN